MSPLAWLALAVGLLLAAPLLVAFGAWWWMIRMPGRNFRGPAAPLDADGEALAAELRRDVEAIAGAIGERNLSRAPDALIETASYLVAQLTDAGWSPRRETFPADGQPVDNVYADEPGDAALPLLIVCAHYDTVPGSPGANDNTSAIAAALALARRLRDLPSPRTARLRILFPVNEERPYFFTPEMGAVVHAAGCKAQGLDVAGVVNLETIGYYSSEPGSQHYPPPMSYLYPSTGDFIGFVANTASRRFTHRLVRSFRRHAQLPSQGATITERMRDIRRSDHAAFWDEGWPGVMVTDTANFRYAHYHLPTDTPDRLNYAAMARLVQGLAPAIRELTGR